MNKKNNPIQKLTQDSLIHQIFQKILPFHGFIYRESQEKLALSIYKGLSNHKIALYESGVGSGKTLAYLVASLVYQKTYNQNNQVHGKSPIFITTSNIELQTAIIRDYIPQLSNILLTHHIIDQPIQVVLRKGKEHYFGRLRYENLMTYLEASQKDKDKILRSKLLQLNLGNHSLDLDSYPTLKNHILQKINVPKQCGHCPYQKNCNYIKFLQRAKSYHYDIQVCNHNYYLNAMKTLQKKNSLIPLPLAVIIDEAHKLPDAAAQAFSTSFSNQEVLKVAHLYLSNGIGNKAVHMQMKSDSNKLLSLTKQLFDSLSLQSPVTLSSTHLIKIKKMLQVLHSMRERQKEKVFDSWLLQDLQERLEQYLTPHTSLFWIESPSNTEKILYELPKNTNQKFMKLLWNDSIPKVITSATLTINNNFQFYKEKVGLNQLPPCKLTEEKFSSSFHYRQNTLLYISDSVLPPNGKKYLDERYIQSLIDHITQLLLVSSGHTVLLFTSYQLLLLIYNRMEGLLSFPMFRMDKSSKSTIAMFKQSKNGVLFASGSCWEGIDCPGDILSSLIIVTLPFPVPNLFMQQKQSQYSDIQTYIQKEVVAEMLLKLKQGAGRLIRTENDTGLIGILDYRAGRHGNYRTCVLQALSEYPLASSLLQVRQAFLGWKDRDYFMNASTLEDNKL